MGVVYCLRLFRTTFFDSDYVKKMVCIEMMFCVTHSSFQIPMCHPSTLCERAGSAGCDAGFSEPVEEVSVLLLPDGP